VGCFDGAHDTIVERASQWMLEGESEYENAEALSVNLMALHTKGRLHLYVAPRRLMVGGFTQLLLARDHEVCRRRARIHDPDAAATTVLG
jgi:hypothetical protein